MSIKTRVTGELAQLVTCQLEPGQTLYADANKFRWKTTNVTIETRLTSPTGPDQSGKKGLLAGALEVGKRALAGQGLAFQWFQPSGGSGLVSFAGNLPGQVKVIELTGDQSWFTEKEAFLCAESGIKFDIALSSLATGYRSREGLILEHFSGAGTLVVCGGGTVSELDLANYGGMIQLHAGAVVAFPDTVSYQTERIGALNSKTAMTAIFGGQGFNLITLEGSGTVLVQATLHQVLEDQQQQTNQERHGIADEFLNRI